jgi:GNAT superfamily N-acetyltransferase
VIERIETTGINPAARPELVIRRARTAGDAVAFQRVTAAAFNAPPEFADSMIPSPAYVLDADIGLFVGALDGVDVAVVGYSRSGPTAVVWGTATLEAYRGRGFGAALVRAALADAAARGCTSAALRSGPLSRPLYERLGFRYACNHRTYTAPSGRNVE